ncbi:MAG TPA: LPS assembly protein LptD, partial [Methylomirabilota bacterium]|nr:LPS assembly protein LptD [Methylomirabilota bacterium]
MRTSLRCALLLVAVVVGPAVAPRVASAQPSQAPVVVPTPGGDVTILADRLEEIGPERLLVATGNVEITRGRTRLIADRVEINRASGDAVAQGRVVFYDGEDQLTGRRIDYNLRTGTGVVYEAEGRVAPYYRIGGERMDRLGESVYHIRRGVFTTCEDDPPSWSFKFGSATADLEDFVYGTNASFWVKNIPLIPFVPFFAAAIRRERQTGFLFPKVGTSSDKGFHAEIPFFWAISDSADATIAPIVYTERGFGLTAEHRYVLSADQRGSTSGFLVQETERNDNTTGLGSIKHDWQIGPGLSLKVDVNAVTGDRVLSEYGDRLQQRSSQRVESNVFLTRSWESWNAVGNAFSYQDLTTRRPVELHRLPDLSVTGVRQPIPGLPGFLWELDAGYVNFVRDVGSHGQRLDLLSRVSRPVPVGGLFTVTPFAGGRLTGYDKTVVGMTTTRTVTGPVEVTEDEPRLRRLLLAGADVETQLSRVYSAGGTWGIDALLHSIEPRLTYTWITGRNQDRLPVWTEGVDRIPDGSRIEYSLTNRVRARTTRPTAAEPVRWEAFRFAVGHSYDLRKDTAGDLTGTLIVQPSARLRVRGDVVHSVHGQGVQVATGDVSVRVDRLSVSVGSRYSDPGNINFLTT